MFLLISFLQSLSLLQQWPKRDKHKKRSAIVCPGAGKTYVLKKFLGFRVYKKFLNDFFRF